MQEALAFGVLGLLATFYTARYYRETDKVDRKILVTCCGLLFVISALAFFKFI